MQPLGLFENGISWIFPYILDLFFIVLSKNLIYSQKITNNCTFSKSQKIEVLTTNTGQVGVLVSGNFELYPKTKNIVRRLVTTTLCPKYTSETVNFKREKFMVQGFVKYKCTRGLEKTAIMNFRLQNKTLIERLFSYFFLPEMFQQENAPCHFVAGKLFFFVNLYIYIYIYMVTDWQPTVKTLATLDKNLGYSWIFWWESCHQSYPEIREFARSCQETQEMNLQTWMKTNNNQRQLQLDQRTYAAAAFRATNQAITFWNSMLSVVLYPILQRMIV